MTESLTLQPRHSLAALDLSFEGFMLSREAMRCTPKTLEHYRYTTGAFVTWLKARGVLDVANITPADIRAYLVSLQRRGLRDTSLHAHARGIRAWLRWLVAEGELAASPMARVAMPRLEQRVPPPYSPDEIRALLAACDRRRPLGARDYALVLALLDSGLRASELCSLRVGDVDPRSGLCTIMGKGRKMRQTRLGAKARGAILRMLATRPDVANGDPLWLCATGNALTLGGLQTTLWRLGKRAGVTPCGAHRFRRTFALWCLRDGMDLHSLRTLMGHASLAVLQRYLALAGEDIERAHVAHSPADKLLG